MRTPSPAAPGLALPLSPCSTQLQALLCHLFNLPLPFPEESFLGTNSFLHSALYFPPKSALATFTVTNHQLTHCKRSSFYSTPLLLSAAFCNLPQPISFITMEFFQGQFTPVPQPSQTAPVHLPPVTQKGQGQAAEAQE